MAPKRPVRDGNDGKVFRLDDGFFWGVKDVKIEQALMLTAPFSNRGWGEWARRVPRQEGIWSTREGHFI